MKTFPTAAALVTGGAKRLGRAIVEDLAAQGFAVAIHANTSLDEAAAVAAEIVARGGRAVALAADLRNASETATLLSRARDALGPIELLVNNASVFQPDSAEDFEPETYSAHFDLHVRAPMILSADFAAQLPEDRPGLIVNIIDQRVLAPGPGYFSYTLSKSTLLTMTRTMAQSFAPRIRVNGIGPGPTLKSSRQSDADFEAQVATLPLGRGPELAEFGRAIRFLFDTPSLTGQMIALDGGQHLIWRDAGAKEILE